MSSRGPIEVAIKVDTETFVNVSRNFRSALLQPYKVLHYTGHSELTIQEAKFNVLPPIDSTYKAGDNDSDLELGHASRTRLTTAGQYATPAVPEGF